MNGAAKLLGYLLLCSGLVGGYFWLRKLKSEQIAANESGPLRDVLNTRLPVKQAIDDDIDTVSKEPQATTLSKLREAPRPAELSLPDAKVRFERKRLAPLETSTWRLEAQIVEVVLREDNDIYLTIQSGEYRNCVEAADPKACTASPFYREIAAVRKKLIARFNPSPHPKRVSQRAVLTGIGFFGTASPVGGFNPSNGARLQPLIGIEWNEK